MRQMLMSVLTLGAIMSAEGGHWIGAPSAIGLLLLALAAVVGLRGTTLAAPALWATASALTLGAAESAALQSLGGSDSLTVSLWLFAAAVSTFCPLMAVLGAKRPQDRGWQWVVLSLWVILLVPALQAVAARTGERLELFGAWRMLLWALIAMGLLNYLPTRFALPAVVAAAGQTLLLAPYLLEGTVASQGRAFGTFALLIAACIAMVTTYRRDSLVEPTESEFDLFHSLNDRWFRFRDGWGAFWALRILQRVNESAELSGWSVRLEWTRGFVFTSTENESDATQAISPQTIAQIEQTLDSLLRRFERVDRT
jgi:hypothetical protein